MTEPRRLEGRKVVLTGASRGIGAAVAQRLAAEGADLLLVARSLDEPTYMAGSLNQTAATCTRFGGRVEVLSADLSDEESRARIIPRALECFDGRLDILINNAAAAIYGSALTQPAKRRRLMLEVNCIAPTDLAQAAIPVMRAQGEGWIVNVSSRTALLREGPPYRTGEVPEQIGTYGASKAALNRITNAIAVETFRDGIRINTIEPKSAVMSEGAEVLVGGKIDPYTIESMEAMVEGLLVLCDCGPEWTGHIHNSLDLLDRLGIAPKNLDGNGLFPGGQRPLPATS